MNRIQKELVGRIYGFLRVTYITKELAIGCVCACGRHVILSYAALADGSVVSCGCTGENAPDVQLKVLYTSLEQSLFFLKLSSGFLVLCLGSLLDSLHRGF